MKAKTKTMTILIFVLTLASLSAGTLPQLTERQSINPGRYHADHLKVARIAGCAEVWKLGNLVHNYRMFGGKLLPCVDCYQGKLLKASVFFHPYRTRGFVAINY